MILFIKETSLLVRHDLGNIHVIAVELTDIVKNGIYLGLGCGTSFIHIEERIAHRRVPHRNPAALVQKIKSFAAPIVCHIENFMVRKTKCFSVAQDDAASQGSMLASVFGSKWEVPL